jgi:rhamnulokinase
LIGVERSVPILSEECRELNFTNEIGFGGSVRLLKNIIGLWLVQECRRQWQSEGKAFDYPELTRRASLAQPFASLIDPSAPEFLAPQRMANQVAEFCRRTGQGVPADEGATIRCILESLALLYRRALKQLEKLLGSTIDVIHIVGGGGRNELLNQFTANACQIPVITGPIEATAAGNILIQAIALGDVPTLAAARTIIRASTDLRTFIPAECEAWESQFARFERVLENRDGK